MTSTPPLSWSLGDLRIHAVVESVTTRISRFVLPQATPEAVGDAAWLSPFLDEERRLLLTIQSFLIVTPTRRLLVDTCVGNDKERRFREWNELRTP